MRRRPRERGEEGRPVGGVGCAPPASASRRQRGRSYGRRGLVNVLRCTSTSGRAKRPSRWSLTMPIDCMNRYSTGRRADERPSPAPPQVLAHRDRPGLVGSAMSASRLRRPTRCRIGLVRPRVGGEAAELVAEVGQRRVLVDHRLDRFVPDDARIGQESPKSLALSWETASMSKLRMQPGSSRACGGSSATDRPTAKPSRLSFSKRRMSLQLGGPPWSWQIRRYSLPAQLTRRRPSARGLCRWSRLHREQPAPESWSPKVRKFASVPTAIGDALSF